MVLELRRPRGQAPAARPDAAAAARSPRFIRLPGQAIRFLPLEALVGLYLDRLFPGFEVDGAGLFPHHPRQRDRDRGRGRGSRPLFETALKRRRRGNVIRLKVNAGMPEDLLAFVIDELDVEPEDVFLQDGLLGLASTASSSSTSGRT